VRAFKRCEFNSVSRTPAQGVFAGPSRRYSDQNLSGAHPSLIDCLRVTVSTYKGAASF
jgi:hypothetical protein